MLDLGPEYLRGLGVSQRATMISGGRMENLRRSKRVDLSLAEGELIASRARSVGLDAKHKGILIEACKEMISSLPRKGYRET